MTDNAKIADNKPAKIQLEKDKRYFFCRCGLSAQQPFCDGSHRGSNFSPLVFTADDNKAVFLCQCKQSKKQPYCDGSHNKISS